MAHQLPFAFFAKFMKIDDVPLDYVPALENIVDVPDDGLPALEETVVDPVDDMPALEEVVDLPVVDIPALEILRANLRIENIEAAAYLEILKANPKINKCQFLFECIFVQLKEILPIQRLMERENQKVQKVAGISAAKKYVEGNPVHKKSLDIIQAEKSKIDNLLRSVISLPRNIFVAHDFRNYSFLVSTPDQVRAAAYLRDVRKVWVRNRVRCLKSVERFVKAACSLERISLDVIGEEVV